MMQIMIAKKYFIVSLMLIMLAFVPSCDEEESDEFVPWGTLTYDIEIDGETVTRTYDLDDIDLEGRTGVHLGLEKYNSRYQIKLYDNTINDSVYMLFPLSVAASDAYIVDEECVYYDSPNHLGLNAEGGTYAWDCAWDFSLYVDRWDTVAEGHFSGYLLELSDHTSIYLENGQFSFSTYLVWDD